MEKVIEVLAASGPLGAILVVLGVAYWRQAVELRRVNEARTADAQKVASTLLEIQRETLKALNELTEAVGRLADRLDDWRSR